MELQINESRKTYFVSWKDTDPLEAWMRIAPRDCTLRISEGWIIPDMDVTSNVKIVKLFRTIRRTDSEMKLPPLETAEYRFEMFDNSECAGEPLFRSETFIGERIPVEVSGTKYDEDTVRVQVQCEYGIPSDKIWFEFSAWSNMGERFYLPEMKREGRFFRTFCYFDRAAWNDGRLKLAIDARMACCLYVKR